MPRSLPNYLTTNHLSTPTVAILAQGRVWCILRVLHDKTKRHASQRMANSRSAVWVVRSYPGSASEVGELAQGRAQRFRSLPTRPWSRSSAQAPRAPTVSSHQWPRETHSGRGASGRTRTCGELGNRHQFGWRVRPHISSSPRGIDKHASGESEEFFIERATKRVENAWQEVDDAKAKMASAEATLTAELSSLHDGEQRHAALLVEFSGMPEQPPPTWPVDFAAELAQLRSLVAELQREREELRFEFGQRGASTLFDEARPRKSTRYLRPI